MDSWKVDHVLSLLETLDMWTKALDDGQGLDVIYLDDKKAFDSVLHKKACRET